VDVENKNPPIFERTRHLLTFAVVIVSIAGILFLGYMGLGMEAAKKENVQFVFTALLPLFASWVGTILAYYFSRENFQAATHSINQLARVVTSAEKLAAIPVSSVIRRIADIKYLVSDGSQDKSIKLSDLLVQFAAVSRIVIVHSEGNPILRLLIYKAIIHEFIASVSLKKINVASANAPDMLTLDDLLSNPARKALFQTSFGFVKETATLAEAKAVMEAIRNCNDVFVTTSGNKDEPIKGWITDNTIAKHSRV